LHKVLVCHLKSDQASGLFLSGGVDSTLLLALIREQGHVGFPVFSISNAGHTQDEGFAQQAARQYNARLYPVHIGPQLLKSFPDFIARIDQPIADTGAWMTWMLSQEAHRQGLRVILSGAGADELFGGYHRHLAFQQYLNYHQLLKPLLPLSDRLAPLFIHNRLLYKLLRQWKSTPAQTFPAFTRLHPHLLPPVEPHWQPKEDYLTAALRFDEASYLQQDILRITDHFSMQASIEVRLPYLDGQVRALAHSYTGNELLRNGLKWMLKKLLIAKGGQVYVKRRKEGLGLPFGKWLFEPEGQDLLYLLQNRESLVYEWIPYLSAQQLLQQSRKSDYSAELWALVLLAGWLEYHFQK
jgi:asparagine synthase (glutamine-hydrolysing)